jgi:hypothetical protein
LRLQGEFASEQEKERYLDFFPMPPERYVFNPARALPAG